VGPSREAPSLRWMLMLMVNARVAGNRRTADRCLSVTGWPKACTSSHDAALRVSGDQLQARSSPVHRTWGVTPLTPPHAHQRPPHLSRGLLNRPDGPAPQTAGRVAPF
jgi:hypothetical protein